jgi:3-hydroxyisobutyrate dehydrogenase-like beta-hydroxyacid dehydrogenase
MGMTVGLLHPGTMGAQVGRCLRQAGVRVVWASESRSRATSERARTLGLTQLGTLADVLTESQYLIAVCPPHGAMSLASQVMALGFRGFYVDANAISPQLARVIEEKVEVRGAKFVDGGLIGPPPVKPGVCRLYLSGRHANEVAELFAQSDLEALVVSGDGASASALKMCYAASTKIPIALLAAIRALADSEGVSAELLREWSWSQPSNLERMQAISAAAGKGWRWVGEMQEMARTFAASGLPPEFALGAEEVCRRWVAFRDDAAVSSDEAVATLIQAGGGSP